jgi:hypothetical protein
MLNNPIKSLLGVLALILLLATPSLADTTHLINFDVDQNGVAVGNGTLLNTAYSTFGATFGADDVVRVSGGGVPSPPNMGAGSIANFTSPIDILFTNVANFVGATNVTNSSFTLTVFDASNNVLGSVSSSTFLEVVTLTFAGQIKRAQFTVAGPLGQYAIDDLRFQVVDGQTNVPEPATLLLLGSGLLGVATKIRSRRKVK